MSATRVAFQPAQVDDEATMRNFRELTRIIARLQDTEAATPSRVFISELTGVGPWTWTGLNGDAPGLRGYEIVFAFDKTAAAAWAVGLQFNGDTAANYTSGATSAAVTSGSAGGGETVQGVSNIAVAKSGRARTVITRGFAIPAIATRNVFSCWNPTTPISSISLLTTTGTVDGSSVALYALMDVTA